MDTALAVAIRSLNEKARLYRRLAAGTSHTKGAARFTALADEAETALHILDRAIALISDCTPANPAAS